MDALLDAVDIYFAGERGLGLSALVSGVVVVGAGVWVWRSGMTGFGTGLAVPLFVLCLLLFGLGGYLTATSGGKMAAFKQQVQSDQVAALQQEATRVEAIATTFSRLKLLWMVIGCASFILVWWGGGRDWLRGAALGMVVFCAVAMVIDTFGHRRTVIYLDAIAAARAP